MEYAKMKLSARELRMIIMALDYLSHDRLTYDEDFNPIAPAEYEELQAKLTALRSETLSRPAMATKWRGRLTNVRNNNP